MTGPEARGGRPARPLQLVALGLLVVALTAPFRGYDALADPAGWVLVLLGLHQLPADVPRRRALLGLALIALTVSLPLWLPTVAGAARDADRSLLWLASLPQLAVTGLLCHVVAGRAAAAGDVGPSTWLRLAVVSTAVVAAAPVLVFGAGLDRLEAGSYLLGAVTLLLVVCLLLAWSGRPWAGVVPRPHRSGETAAGDRSGP